MKNKKEKNKPNHKEIMFCEEYIKTLNATKSYLKAYPNASYNTAKNNGCRLLAKDYILNYIEERLNNIKNNKIADADEILEFLTSTLRGEIKDQLGFETSVKDRIKAGELLAKRYRLFEETKEKEEYFAPKISIEVVDNSELESVLYEDKK